MASRFLIIIVLGLACVVAAGTGGYLAVRHGQVAAQPAAHPSSAPAQMAAESRPADPVGTSPVATEIVLPARPASAAPVRPEPRHKAEPQVSRPAPEPNVADGGRKAADNPDTAIAPPEVLNPKGGGTAADPAGQAAAPQPAAQVAPPSAPERQFIEVTVPSESVLGLQVQTSISSETARIEDRVEARVTRDVRVNEQVAIPAGSQAIGTVVQVDRGGKVKERAHFAIRFTSLVLPDGSRLPITAEAVHREGPSPAKSSTAKIGGGAAAGAILGAILGGGKGAAIGGSIGAAGGTAATMAADRQPATLPAGTMVNIRLMAPVTVTLER